jgi:hypothetical protein
MILQACDRNSHAHCAAFDVYRTRSFNQSSYISDSDNEDGQVGFEGGDFDDEEEYTQALNATISSSIEGAQDKNEDPPSGDEKEPAPEIGRFAWRQIRTSMSAMCEDPERAEGSVGWPLVDGDVHKGLFMLLQRMRRIVDALPYPSFLRKGSRGKKIWGQVAILEGWAPEIFKGIVSRMIRSGYMRSQLDRPFTLTLTGPEHGGGRREVGSVGPSSPGLGPQLPQEPFPGRSLLEGGSSAYSLSPGFALLRLRARQLWGAGQGVLLPVHL